MIQLKEKNKLSPIDLSVLKNIFNNDADLMRKFSKKFIQVAEEVITEIEAAKIRSDLKALESQGHKLKSSARTIGAHHFAELCDGLEIAAIKSDWAQIEHFMSQISVSFNHVKQQLEDEIRERE